MKMIPPYLPLVKGPSYTSCFNEYLDSDNHNVKGLEKDKASFLDR